MSPIKTNSHSHSNSHTVLIQYLYPLILCVQLDNNDTNDDDDDDVNDVDDEVYIFLDYE